MGKLIDLTGLKFGRLTVIKRVEDHIKPNGKPIPMWLCKCECNNKTIVAGDKLRNGRTRSCGCLSKEITSKKFKKHGHKKTRLYRIWIGIKTRCYNNNNPNYKNYGNRGIKICDEWLSNFINFYNWAMDNGYKEGLSIDRIDNNKGYSPKNCRWVNRKIQNNNRRNNIYIKYNNKIHTIAEWANIYNIKYHTLIRRLYSGWDFEKAISQPIRNSI